MQPLRNRESAPHDRRIDIRLLDEVPDATLDELPFGVIGLSPGGTILRYNLAEARLARLDRNQVLGRNFFEEVAPCTATPEFEDRFRAFVAAPPQQAISFPYVFDFAFGAQEVDIEVVAGSSGDTFYLCINRRRFLPRRPDQPDHFYAPTQAELAPDEAEQGVQRDDRTRRSVAASPVFFEGLRYAWDRVAPRGWPEMSEEWGRQWGRLAVVDLEMDVQEAEGCTLRELRMSAAVERISRYLLGQGWGRLGVDLASVRRGVFEMEFERSALAEAAGASETPRCQLLAGFLSAIFSHLASHVIAVREGCCKSQGFPCCRFVAVSEARLPELEAALERHEEDVDAVVAELGKGS